MCASGNLLPWFQRWGHVDGKDSTMFCFPCAGGSPMMFASWGNVLVETSVCSALLPGRGTRLREPPVASMRTLVPQLATALTKHCNGPFMFFGHSMGALVAFEVARELQRRLAATPSALFVFGTGAPHFPTLLPPMSGLPVDEFRIRLRDLNGTPNEVLKNAELFTLLLPSMRGDFELVESYQYQHGPPLLCPIVALGGNQDPETAGERLTEWRAHTKAWFQYGRFEGDHFFPFKNESVFLDHMRVEIQLALCRTNVGIGG
jgi:medium-chain acyl-[acyl-carrier-protein] hydrolase